MPWLTVLTCIAFLLTSCEEEKIASQGINYIGYGKSFGECLGYCIHSMKVNRTEARLTKCGWDASGLLQSPLLREIMESMKGCEN